MNTTMKKLSALALATAALSATTLATSSIASANGTGVIVPTQGNVHGTASGSSVNGPVEPGRGTGVIVPTKGNVHGPVTGGNVHGSGTTVLTGGTGVIVPTQGNVHGPAGTGVIEPPRPAKPGQVISCHPGTGCTLTPAQPPAGSPPASNPPGQVISCHPGTGCTLTPPQPPVDQDHGHDYDHDHDHWHWSHWDHRGWDFPVIEVSGYAPESCVYVYKFRTIYVPGVGLERAVVKVCEAE